MLGQLLLHDATALASKAPAGAHVCCCGCAATRRCAGTTWQATAHMAISVAISTASQGGAARANLHRSGRQPPASHASDPHTAPTHNNPRRTCDMPAPSLSLSGSKQTLTDTPAVLRPAPPVFPVHAQHSNYSAPSGVPRPPLGGSGSGGTVSKLPSGASEFGMVESAPNWDDFMTPGEWDEGGWGVREGGYTGRGRVGVCVGQG